MKKKEGGILPALMLVLLAVVLISGCTKGPAIVGTWDNTKAAETITFRADGSGSFSYPKQDNPPLAFTWKQSGEKNYLVEITFQGTRKVLMATVAGSSLTLSSSAGNETYTRHSGS